MEAQHRPGGWGKESLYSEAPQRPEDVLYEGSDDEDYDSASARRLALEAAAYRYSNGTTPFLLSAALKGPFTKKSGWRNPWSSSKVARRKIARTRPTGPAAQSLLENSSTVHQQHGNPSKQSRGQIKDRSPETWATDGAHEFPSLAELPSTHIEPNPFMDEEAYSRVQLWMKEVDADVVSREEFWASEPAKGSLSNNRKRMADPSWLRTEALKRMKTDALPTSSSDSTSLMEAHRPARTLPPVTTVSAPKPGHQATNQVPDEIAIERNTPVKKKSPRRTLSSLAQASDLEQASVDELSLAKIDIRKPVSKGVDKTRNLPPVTSQLSKTGKQQLEPEVHSRVLTDPETTERKRKSLRRSETSHTKRSTAAATRNGRRRKLVLTLVDAEQDSSFTDRNDSFCYTKAPQAAPGDSATHVLHSPTHGTPTADQPQPEVTLANLEDDALPDAQPDDKDVVGDNLLKVDTSNLAALEDKTLVPAKLPAESQPFISTAAEPARVTLEQEVAFQDADSSTSGSHFDERLGIQTPPMEHHIPAAEAESTAQHPCQPAVNEDASDHREEQVLVMVTEPNMDSQGVKEPCGPSGSPRSAQGECEAQPIANPAAATPGSPINLVDDILRLTTEPTLDAEEEQASATATTPTSQQEDPTKETPLCKSQEEKRSELRALSGKDVRNLENIASQALSAVLGQSPWQPEPVYIPEGVSRQPVSKGLSSPISLKAQASLPPAPAASGCRAPDEVQDENAPVFPPQPSTPETKQSSLPTPEFTFSIKAFRSFRTPSPTRPPQRPNDSPSARLLPSTQALLDATMSNPWAEPSSMKGNKKKPGRHVTFAPLPGEATTDGRDADLFRTEPTSSKPRAASPPPPQLLLSDLPPETDKFGKHFEAAATRRQSGARSRKPPRLGKRLLPSSSQQACPSPSVDAMAKAFVEADAGLGGATTGGRSVSDLEASARRLARRGDTPPPEDLPTEAVDPVSAVLENLSDFLDDSWEMGHDMGDRSTSGPGRESLGSGRRLAFV